METKNQMTRFKKSITFDSVVGRTVINYRTERPSDDEYTINHGHLNICQEADASFNLDINFYSITSSDLLNLAKLFAEAAEELRKDEEALDRLNR